MLPFDFGIKDVIDVCLVVVFLYETYLLMKKTGTMAIFAGILSFIGLWILISKVFQMRLMGAILDKFVNIGLIVLVVIFQKEIREFLQNFGSNKGIKLIIKWFTPSREREIKEDISYTMPIVMAVINMSKRKEGALIVIQQKVSLHTFIETGEILNANLNSRLIENIFFKNSPLHDGAIIIVDKKVKAAGCILPVSQDQNIPKNLGLRHRSALGLSQETDAKVIIVSEETGKISLAYKGKLYVGISTEELQKRLINKK